MRFLGKLFGFLALASVFISGAFAADMITTNDTDEILTIVQSVNGDAKLTTDDYGDPLITASNDGTDYQILFYECMDGADCQYLNFATSFDLENGWNVRRVNKANRRLLHSRVWLDEGFDPVIESSIIMAHGVTPETFRATLEYFLAEMYSLENELAD